MNKVPKGPLPVGSDAAVVVRVTPNAKLRDLSTVTSATFTVYKAGSAGTPTTWTPVLQNQTADTLDLVYVYLTHDIDVPGTYAIDVTAYVGARAVRQWRVTLDVTP
jgi:hypothetical protein